MSNRAFYLIPLNREVLTWDQIVNAVGYRPPVHAVQAFLERRGFYLSGGHCFRKASDIVRKAGRPPTRREIHAAENGMGFRGPLAKG